MNQDAKLDLHDIQGNIIRAYPRAGLPKGRYVFFRVTDGTAGRAFIRGLVPLITTSAPWPKAAGGIPAPPRVATNVGFTFDGLRHLGVPQATLQSFPDEFAMGMRARRELLGDDGPSAPECWDPIWAATDRVDISVMIHGKTDEAIEARYQAILALLPADRGVELLIGHRGDGGAADLPFQQASSLFIDGEYSPKEHFGFTDGISNPYFRGADTHPSNAIGGGKVTGGDVETLAGWEPLETGEFLLGQKDEAFELPVAPIPSPLARNGSYLVYRKLHQNIGSFDAYLEDVGKVYPGGKEALAAKFVGRWRNGAPITTFPTEKEADAFAQEWDQARRAIDNASTIAERDAAKERFSKLNRQFVAFDYRKDPDGAGCPFGAHTRRVHSRAALEMGMAGAFETPDALVIRRRLLRRGIAYGESVSERTDAGNHGLIFIAFCANLQRQFEFVQQQWINYGNDFQLSNDKDPLVGNHGTDSQGAGTGRMVIEGGPGDSTPPFFCSQLPRFVETRGGDYFFVPGMTALRLIADGTVDPS